MINFYFFFIFFGIYKPNFCHRALSSIVLIILSTWLSNDDESLFAKKPFCFSNFLISIFSPNFFLRICSAFPRPSIRPKFKDVDPDQNSPVNILFFSGSFNFEPRLLFTKLIKSECNSNCNFFILSMSSGFSSLKGSRVLLFLPAV